MTAQRDLSVAELDLVNAMTTYQKAKVELDRATGATLEHNGVLIQDAVSGTVYCFLSISHAEPGQIAVSTSPAPARDSQHRAPRVFAADDQRPILEALEFLLRPQGYAVDGVKSPAAARAEALANRFL